MKRTRHLMLVVALAPPLFAIASDVPGPTPDPGATKKVYGDTPEELLPYGRFTEPYKTFFLEPNEYRGYGRHIPEPERVESVKIGFLGPIEPTVSVATGGASHEEPLGRKMLAKLKVFAGPEHKHAAQEPLPLGDGGEGLDLDLDVTRGPLDGGGHHAGEVVPVPGGHLHGDRGLPGGPRLSRGLPGTTSRAR